MISSMPSLNCTSDQKNPLEQSDPISPRRPVGSLGPLARAFLGSVPFRQDRDARAGHMVAAAAAAVVLPWGGGSPVWIEVPEKSKSAFWELKRRKGHRYVIFKIDYRSEEIIVEKTGPPGESYDDFTASLPADDCRFYDLDFVSDDNCRKSKIFFISWSPSLPRIRAKTIYAVSRNQFRHELDGVRFEIQATDPDDMDLEVLRGRANRT